MNSYSQHQEDLFIFKRLYSDARYNDPGIILDIGANDGITYSNSRYFIESLGWKAVLVEPTSQCITKLNNLYSNNPNVTIYPYAIDSINSETIIYLGNLDPNTINQVSTMSASEKMYWETNRNVRYTEEVIQTKTIEQLRSDIDIDYFDIISIDTEGKDILILDKLYEIGYRPEFFIIEHNSNMHTIQRLNDILQTEYKIVWQNTINYILQKI